MFHFVHASCLFFFFFPAPCSCLFCDAETILGALLVWFVGLVVFVGKSAAPSGGLCSVPVSQV